jgi:hypothetical protein
VSRNIYFPTRFPEKSIAQPLEALRVEMREGFTNIQTELKDIRLRIDVLEVATQNVSGFAKEIDHLATRRRYREAPWHSPAA